MKIATLFLLLSAGLTCADSIRFPADSGVVDVTKPPYSAVGDGQTDCTTAIQKAMDDHPSQRAIIYLPNGTYLVSDTIKWPAGSGGNTYKRTCLQGESEAGTVLKLADGAKGFDNPEKPKGIVWTGPKPAQRFGNEIRNITLDAGRKNSGAAGAQYNTSNQGSIRNVTIRTEDTGAIGLDMNFTGEIGPCLIRDVTVRGFDTGVWCGHSVNSMTFERLALEGQKRVGFRDSGQVVSIRGFKSTNSVPAFLSDNPGSLVVLIDAELTGTLGAERIPAISNYGAMFVRNLQTKGYGSAIENKNGLTPSSVGPVIQEWISHPVLSLFPSPARSLALPVKDSPVPGWAPLEDWVAPQGIDLSAKVEKRNDLEAIQAAIDAGKGTVYLPHGTYRIEGDLILRGTVNRLIGCGARITGQGRIVLADGAAPAVSIERLEISYSPIQIAHESKRTLILSGMVTKDYLGTGGGDVFLDDVVGGPYAFNKQNVWARQINPEPMGLHISNHGGNLWILGLKTERGGVLVETKNGKSEILGCHNYSTTGPKTTPAFNVENGALSLTVGETNYNKNPYIALVQERRDQDTRTLYKDDAFPRNFASMIPLFVGYSGAPPVTVPIKRTKPAPAMPTPGPSTPQRP